MKNHHKLFKITAIVFAVGLGQSALADTIQIRAGYIDGDDQALKICPQVCKLMSNNNWVSKDDGTSICSLTSTYKDESLGTWGGITVGGKGGIQSATPIYGNSQAKKKCGAITSEWNRNWTNLSEFHNPELLQYFEDKENNLNYAHDSMPGAAVCGCTVSGAVRNWNPNQIDKNEPAHADLMELELANGKLD